MIVHYDALDRLEKPNLVLCNPGSIFTNSAPSSVVGGLTDCEAEELVLNFNATSTLNFRINRVQHEDEEDNAHIYAMYKAVQNRRLVFINEIGYFMITNVVDGYEDGRHYKDVTAQSVDVEIQQKMIPYIADGTYRFTTADGSTNPGILETIVEVLPLWTIGHVDDEVASRSRTFEEVDLSLNCLGFLQSQVQDAYECIIIFDIINRQINVYDQSNYIRQTSIQISYDDVINSLDMTENAEDIYTALTVTGDEEMTISAINPTGTSTLYNFGYYLDWMTPELRAKVSAWQQLLSDRMDTYYITNLDLFEKRGVLYNLEAERDRLNMQITMYQRCRDNIVAETGTSFVQDYNDAIVDAGGTEIVVEDMDIEDILYEIDNLLAECESLLAACETQINQAEAEIDTVKQAIDRIRHEVSISNYFTEEEYAELSHYIFEGTYTDEYVVLLDGMTYAEQFEQMKVLYDRATQRLSTVSQPKQEFHISAENFIFAKEFAHWSEQLETGCLINVEVNEEEMAVLILTNITVNFDDHDLQMTFGNRFNRYDTKSLFDNLLGQISKSANTLNYIKELLYPIRSGEFNEMKAALQSSRDITMAGALASSGEEVIIDGSGYTGRKLQEDGRIDPRQIKITGRNIVFTDDAWRSAKVAIGELLMGDGGAAYGINAETVIGDIIMGNNLHIIDENGNELLSVVDDRISTQVGDTRNRVTALEQTANDITIQISSLSEAIDNVDHVTTTTGYTFDADGLRITRTGEEIVNLLDNTGMYVTRSGDEILTANNEGVRAINLSSSQFLIVGKNSRFEDYNDGVDPGGRTACFFIGYAQEEEGGE